jgi:enoyl-CoA hydratase/carnithine racemase
MSDSSNSSRFIQDNSQGAGDTLPDEDVITSFGPGGLVRIHEHCDEHGRLIAELTLFDPDRRNAMTEPMTQAWSAALDHLRGRVQHGLRCVVLSGAGSAFCAGGDLTWLGAKPGAAVAELRHRMMPFYATWLGIRDLGVPTIAAVNGPAVGAGAALVLACDVAVAGSHASFSVPFLRLGLHPGMGITYLLPAAVGRSAARDLLLTGRRVDAARMYELGIVSEVVDDAELAERARAMAWQIAEAAPVALELTSLALAEGQPTDVAAALRWEGIVQSVTLATEDLAEGLQAAKERRAPVFQGR